MLNFDCGIYAIGSPDGRDYIGQAQSFVARWDKHRSELRKGRHHCKSLQAAFNRFGEEAIIFKKIAIVPVSDLDLREQEQLDSRPREVRHNTSSRAYSGSRGLKRSNEFKRHCSERQRGEKAYWFGKKLPESTLKRMSESLKGKRLSEETRAKLSAAHRGKVKSAEHRANLAAAGFGKTRPDSYKKVICVELGLTFESLKSAHEWVRENLNPKASIGNLSSACTGRSKKSYGHTWRYVDRGESA